MGAIVEIFADSSPLSIRFLEEIKDLFCPKCEVIIYSLDEPDVLTTSEDKTIAYGIESIPAVIINGRIVDVDKLKKTKLTPKQNMP